MTEQRSQPNILLILNDDMGFSDIACYGGEVQTPTLNALAADGLRYTQFYNTARCCPSRASLLTGLYPHQADVGHMVGDDEIDGYRGDLNPNTVTIAESLKSGGYATYMSGKWHVSHNVEQDGPKHSWPSQRGFDDFYGIITGAANYYRPRTLTRNNAPIDPEGDGYFITDAISDEAVRQIREHASGKKDKPFFQYVAYTAPHWPLHAHEEDIAKYKGRFDAGWDTLRAERLERLVDMGIIHENWKLSTRDPEVLPWEEQDHKDWETRRMEVYAAQIDRMDQGIGRVVEALKETDQFDNTLIVFLADNGGCAEELGGGSESWVKRLVERHPYVGTLETRDGRPVRFGNHPDLIPGPEDTYSSYGLPWANVSNTPFRMYKHWVHEGGIATPFIVHWPQGIQAKGELRHQAAQLPDVMATFLEIADIDYPEQYEGKAINPLEGVSLVPTFTNQPHDRGVLYWEHEGNRAVRKDKWKLVAKCNQPWELYDMTADRSELNDLSAEYPEIVDKLKSLYFAWAERCNVWEFDDLRALRQPKFRARREARRVQEQGGPRSELPHVLLIGDSISQAYTPVVRDLLKDCCHIERPKANCGDTRAGLEHLDEWLGKRQWDLIHFNWGLHDLCYRHPEAEVYGNRDKSRGTISVPPEAYRRNLQTLVERLKECARRLAWASTTFVPPGEAGRYQGDDLRYNAIAADIMDRYDIPINDLHALTASFDSDMFMCPGDVHFSAAGTRKIAKQVAACIRRHLQII